MTTHIIFDLSEVIIFGIIGIENILCDLVSTPKEEIIDCFGGEKFRDFMHGEISEDDYLKDVLKRQNWNIDFNELKILIRKNFEIRIEGTIEIVRGLSKNYKLILLSDHSKEWVDHIKSVHKFFDLFDKIFFSYELGMTKKNPELFKRILNEIQVPAENCLFIDDSKRNVNHAKMSGIAGIHFTTAENLKEELRKKNIRIYTEGILRRM